MRRMIILFKDKVIAAGFTVVLVWVTWVSASINLMGSSQAALAATALEKHKASDELTLKVDHLYSVAAVRDTQVAVLDTKLNLLLMSQGIPIPTNGEDE